MTCRLCRFTLLHLGLVQKYLYLLYKSRKSIFSKNKKKKPNHQNKGWLQHETVSILASVAQHLSVLLSIRPVQTPFTASESIHLLLFAAYGLPLWLTLHSSLPLFSLLLSNPCPHALLLRLQPSSRQGIKQARGKRTREREGEKGGKTNWWWPVRERRAIKWAKTEAWWDGEVASQLQSDIEGWGEGEDWWL